VNVLDKTNRVSGIAQAVRIACAVLLIGLLMGGAASAATFTVPGNFATIAAAVAGAPDGSTILVAPGTYSEMIDALNLNKSLCLQANGAPGSVVLSGAGKNRLLRILNSTSDQNRNLTFDGFTFANGVGATSISPVTIAAAKPAFLNCIFQDNYAPEKGGAVLVYGSSVGHPSFVNCVFRRNASDRCGGAVLVNGGHCKATFKDCLFEDNTSRTAASTAFNEGGAITYAAAGGALYRCTFRRNSTTYAGGAIMAINDFSEPLETIRISGCVFDANFALQWSGSTSASPPTEGGAITAENNVCLEIEGTLFTNNYAQSGGAIQNYRSQTKLQGCVFDSNRAIGTSYLGFGGALALNSQDTGAVNYPSSAAWVNDTHIRNCLAPVGGGIYVSGDGSRGTSASDRAQLFMKDVVVGNCRSTTAGSSYGNGGGIYLGLAHCAGTNVFVLRNQAQGLGGGLVVAYNTFCQLNRAYIVGNESTLSGDAYYTADTPAPSFLNSTLAYNGGSGTGAQSVLAAIPSVSHGSRAYLAYVNMPFGTPAISPRVGTMPNNGGYAAGSVLDAALDSNTTYTLSSQYAGQPDTVTHSSHGILNVGYGVAYHLLPGPVEAENFDQGGERVAYRDLSPQNEGGAYRPSEGVDVGADPNASGGNFVGWLLPGEWMDYIVHVGVAGSFNLNARISSSGSGSFYVQVDGADVTGTMNAFNTGGAWQDVTRRGVSLSRGFHHLRFVVVTPGFNLDRIALTPSAPSLSVSPLSLNRSVKVGGNAVARSFDVVNAGGSNMAYTVSESASWLSVSANSGVSSGEADTINVLFNSASLSVGTYTAKVTVTASGALNSPQTVNVTLRVRPNVHVINDFDGDGSSDYGVYYAPGGNWYVFRSSLGFLTDQFGYAGTIPVAGDFDNDKRSDLCIYYPRGGNWYLFRSSLGFYVDQFGYAGTVPVSGDFDGDGISDLAVYYPPGGNWYIFRSRLGFHVEQFGYAGTVPVPGDYDGDGKFDLALYDPASRNWFIFKSGSGMYTENFGVAGGTPVSGDFDGDGKYDLAVYHAASGTWYINRSTAGLQQTQFGYAGSVPLSGDFDGDGVSDLIVYEAARGLWNILGSAIGFYTDQFGFPGTVPLGGVALP
jgi:hypothetical protein